MPQDTHQACQHSAPADMPALPAQEQVALAAAMCAAMSDAARLRLLLWLLHSPTGELCVSELVAFEQAKLTSVSARLQRLHAARLVSKRRDAKHVFYSLADEHVRDLVRNVLGHAAEPLPGKARAAHAHPH